MLKQFLNGIIGKGTQMGFGSYTGISSIPSQGGFGQVFNNFLLGGGGRVGGFPQQGFGGISPGAIQAFQGAQNQFSDPKATKTIKHQALAPGAVLIGSQSTPPSFNKSNPFQGFAGQTTQLPGGFGQGFGGGFGQPFSSQFPGAGLLGGLGGGLQSLLFPIISVVGMIKSIFGFRKEIGALRPVVVDKGITGYNQSQQYLAEEYTPGGFDEPAPFDQESFAESLDTNVNSYF